MTTLRLRATPIDAFFVMSLVLMFGYFLMSRTFAHWGLAPFYIGEVSLVVFFLAKPISMSRPWLGSLAGESELSGFGWWLAISLLYGMLEVLRALYTGARLIDTAEVLVVHLYPFYLFAGAWVGLTNPTLLPRLIRALAWCHGLYGMAFIMILNPLGLTQGPDNPHAVGFFGHPAGAPIMLLGLLAFEHNMRRAAIPLLLNLMVLLGMQRRAEWLSLIVAVTMWAFLTGRFKQLLIATGLVLGVLVIGLLPDVKFPSPDLRGEPMSTRDLLGRAIAPIDPELASKLTHEADNMAATASWRSDFWRAILKEVHGSELTTIFGLGYDYRLWELHPGNLDPEIPLRTPHSIFLFIVGYSGWLGVVIFTGLQGALGLLLWRTYRNTGEPFGVCLWVLTIVWALFDPLIDRPFGAIPIYLLMGMTAVYNPLAHSNPGPGNGRLSTSKVSPSGANA